tara:strand:+ start:552 stop:758 length:207 start_codon:yes stop_codon:yes gene_type:complete
MMIRQSVPQEIFHTEFPSLIGGTLMATSTLVVKKVQKILSRPYTLKQKKYKLEKVNAAFLAARRLDPS